MRVAASLSINTTDADPAISERRLRSRFVRLLDTVVSPNGFMMSVYPAGTAVYEVYIVSYPLTAELPTDDDKLQELKIAQLPSSLADATVSTTGETALIARAYAPGWYYFRQISAGRRSRRADIYPVATSSVLLPEARAEQQESFLLQGMATGLLYCVEVRVG